MRCEKMNKFLTTTCALAGAFLAVALATSARAQDGAGTVQAGHAKVAMCIGCHGIPGYQASFPEIYKVPKISGQSEKYIASALAAYRGGDRKHPTMRAVADSLSDQDIADVSAYYAAHGRAKDDKPLADKPSREPNAQVAALLQKGACVSCHGANFAKPIDPSYPHLAGQNADYLFVALKSYKVENNATVGRSNGVMAGVAKQFSNAELKALANYIGSIDGDLKTVPQSRFR
jgi:cytochrome c553